MPQRNLVIVLVAAAISYACYVRGEQNPYARFTASTLAAIDQNSLEAVPSRELFDAAVNGMVDVLRKHGDEHSKFFDQRESEMLMEDIHQHFGGIGVRIRFLGEPPRLLIVARPDPNTPADRAQLARGDQILEIDDHSTTDMSMDDVLAAMRGPAGQIVRLKIQPAGDDEAKSFELVREHITVESVLGDVRNEQGRWQFRLAEDSRIAHLRIRSFGDLTAREVARTLKQLTAEGVEAVVLDVRDNAGGTLDAAVAICDLLLPAEQLVVETRGRSGQIIERRMTTGGGPFVELPLAVLVNQQSASAAEIVAACLQDHGRAIVVGQRTYGKGTVQQLIATQAGKSTLKLTWASFWRPSGENIHRMQNATPDEQWGVRPDSDFEVVLSPEEYAEFEAYRGQRDLVGLAPLDEMTSLNEEGQPVVAADFVDRQLARAVEGLQGMLGEAGR